MKVTQAEAIGLGYATKMLKAFADPVRLRLLNLLCDGREICVCHLHEALGLPQPTVSRHLAYLRRTGLVDGRKQGLWVYYRLAKSRTTLHSELLSSLQSSLANLPVFAEDRQRLAQAVSCC